MPLDLPGRQAIANDRHVDGSRGRHQLTTPPSASPGQPPFATPSARILSSHDAEHDPHSTRGAWSAEPSRLLPGPSGRRVRVSPLMPPELEVATKSSRCPTGGCDHTRSSLLMVQMDSSPGRTFEVASLSTTGGSRGGPSAWKRTKSRPEVLHVKPSKWPHSHRWRTC